MTKEKFDNRKLIHWAQIQELAAEKAAKQPHRLPQRLHAHALTQCPADGPARGHWLKLSMEIAHRLEGHVHDQGQEWDWPHFTEVIVPWAIHTWQAMNLADASELQDYYGLTSWLGTWLFWSPPDVAATLEPLARALITEARTPRGRGPWRPLHGESDVNPTDEHPFDEWYRHVALDVDAWEQKTGIDLGIPHGAIYWIVNPAHRPGWKKPRTRMPRH